MLSETRTLLDVKEKLQNIYSFYGYSSDEEFEGILESVSEDVMRIYFYPRLGVTYYETVQAKDAVDLELLEDYLYWAEVYSICYEFLKLKRTVSGQLQTSGNEKLQVEGYSYQTASSSGTSPNDTTLNDYYDKMLTYFKLAGWDLMGLERTCTIFGTSNYPETILTIIE
jgi:hypothetical protein